VFFNDRRREQLLIKIGVIMKKILKISAIIFAFAFLPVLSTLALLGEQDHPNFYMILALILLANQIWIIGGIFLLVKYNSCR